MADELDCQTYGAVTVTGAFIAAELAARLLTAAPASPLVWFVNLELFRPFEMARVASSPLRFLFGPWSLAAAVAVLAMIVVARIRRQRFAIALAANLSFMFTTALVFENVRSSSIGHVASARHFAIHASFDVALVALMAAASCLAFLASHLSFVAAIVTSRSRRPGSPGERPAGLDPSPAQT